MQVSFEYSNLSETISLSHLRKKINIFFITCPIFVRKCTKKQSVSCRLLKLFEFVPPILLCGVFSCLSVLCDLSGDIFHKFAVKLEFSREYDEGRDEEQSGEYEHHEIYCALDA